MADNQVYERIFTEAVLDDAVTVAIHQDTNGNVLAWVKWGSWVGDGVHQHGDFEGPLPVPRALERANELAPLYEFERVVVYVDDFRLWRPEWGTLVSTGTARGFRIDGSDAEEVPGTDDAMQTTHTLDRERNI